MALALTSIRPTFGSACMQVVGHGCCSRRRLERCRSARARREFPAPYAAPSFSFVCTQCHRELTHSPCFVPARKQRRAEVMNCCAERCLVSVVTRVEHHRARGGSQSGDGVGGGFPTFLCLLRSLLGSWRLLIKKEEEKKARPRALGSG